jgi:hypothetical protein
MAFTRDDIKKAVEYFDSPEYFQKVTKEREELYKSVNQFFQAKKSYMQIDKKYQLDAEVDMNDVPFPSSFHQCWKRMEEKLIKEVLKQLLKRDLVIDDAKRVTRMFKDGMFDKYTLAVDNVPIGQVFYEFFGQRVSIRFEPLEMYKANT